MDNKYKSIDDFKEKIGVYPFYEKIESDDEGLLIKEINHLMQKGWIPHSEVKENKQHAGDIDGIFSGTVFSIYMMRSPSVSLPSTQIKDFLDKDRLNENSNRTSK